MDSQTNRKIIVASGMAVVVGISVVAFALSSHHSPSAARVSPAQDSLAPTPVGPAAAVAPAPDAPAAVAQTPAAPAVAQVPAAPAAVAPIPDAPAVAQPKAARPRHLAKAPTSSADTTARVVTPAEPTVEKPAGETTPAEVTPPPAPSGTTTGAQEGSASTEPAAPDAGSPPK